MKSREKALSHLRKSLRSQDRGDELPRPTQKVSVMADSKEGLEEGLNKAEEVLEDLPALEDLEAEPLSEEEALEEDLFQEAEMMDELESEDEVEDLDEILSEMTPEQLKALMLKIKSMV